VSDANVCKNMVDTANRNWSFWFN